MLTKRGVLPVCIVILLSFAAACEEQDSAVAPVENKALGSWAVTFTSLRVPSEEISGRMHLWTWNGSATETRGYLEMSRLTHVLDGGGYTATDDEFYFQGLSIPDSSRWTLFGTCNTQCDTILGTARSSSLLSTQQDTTWYSMTAVRVFPE